MHRPWRSTHTGGPPVEAASDPRRPQTHLTNGRLWDRSLWPTAAMHFRRLIDPEMASHKENLILDMTHGLWDDTDAIADEKDMI